MKTDPKHVDALEHALAHYAAAYRPADDDETMPFNVSEEDREPEYGVPSDPYEPTGNPKLDALLRAAKPVILYGGVPAGSTQGQYLTAEGYVPPEYYVLTFPRREQFTDKGAAGDAAYRSTLAHELVHWTKTLGRVPRKHEGITAFMRMIGVLPEGYPIEELTAEIGAALLLDAVGEDPGLAERGQYIGGWMMPIPPDKRDAAFKRAATQARKAVDYLLSFVD